MATRTLSKASAVLQRFWSQASHHIKGTIKLNFYRLHLCYFIFSIFISSFVLWGANNANFHVRYIDALFLTCSAMCNVGLTTINLGSINAFQQSVLFVMMLMGDLSLVTISVVIIRRYYFDIYMKDFIQHSRTGQRVVEDIEQNGLASNTSTQTTTSGPRRRQLNIHGDSYSSYAPAKQAPSSVHRWHVSGYGGFPFLWDFNFYKRFSASIHEVLGRKNIPEHSYLSFQPQLDHKGRFHSLTHEQEQELGGVEFRALQLLTWLLPAYAIFWLGFIMVVMTPYVSHTKAGNVIQNSQPGNLNPAWWSVFASVSAYTNCGLNLLNENMIPLSNNYLVLIFTGVIILAGNTLYPVLLRGSIWLLSKAVTRHSETHHTLMFLLHHPRRCYLFLFPAKQTLTLLLVQIAINVVAWILFIILNIDYNPIDPLITPGLRVFQGLYQAHGLRASGFYIIRISDVAPSLQFFYMVAMYISAFPILMSIRQTNVYEERSIGQDDSSKYWSPQASSSSEPDNEEGQQEQEQEQQRQQQEQSPSSLPTHLRLQLAYDLWWILLAVWLISIVERPQLPPSASASASTSTLSSPSQTVLSNPVPGFSNGLFSILFETVSAYGAVGLSLGVPYDNHSFSGAWQTLSKLILMAVMLRGRHRILPMAVDRAILLPGQGLMEELDRSNRVNWQERKQDIRERERGEGAEHERNHDDEQQGKHGNSAGKKKR